VNVTMLGVNTFNGNALEYGVDGFYSDGLDHA
jgi:hypothetical protein